MPEIKNREDWWHHYNKNLDDLIDIVVKYADENDIGDNDAVQQMKEWGESKTYSETLFSYLNNAWFFAPEDGCRKIPGWFVLCDLCSESWVFEEEEENVSNISG